MSTKAQLQEDPFAHQSDQSGFVLLTLLFAAAVIAAQLAITLPRAAMEAQRIREEKLIYRGEQYKRGIKLYYRQHQKYPQKIDDLEDTNGVRFLRRRYNDPLTGENEWRLVHMGPDGRFKDSLVYDTEDEENKRFRGDFVSSPPVGAVSGQGSELKGAFARNFDAEGAYHVGQVTDHDRHRHAGGSSEISSLGQEYPRHHLEFTAPGGQFRGADRARAVRQSTAPQVLGSASSSAGVSSSEAIWPLVADSDYLGTELKAINSAYPPRQNHDYSTLLPSQIPPGVGQRIGPPESRRQLRTSQRGDQTQFGQTGAGSTGISSGQRAAESRQVERPPVGFGRQGMASQAVSAIGQTLTRPRPGGLVGLRATQGRADNTDRTFIGGVAGVASKTEERGVKLYRGRGTYNEWEFVFDYREALSADGRNTRGFPNSR